MRNSNEQGAEVKAAQARKLRALVFKRLVLDHRVPHGAVRLFLLLYTYSSKDGRCWPGQRKLRRDLGCSIDSLKPWVESLRTGRYLTTKEARTRAGKITIYNLNLGVFPVSGTPGVPTFGPGVPGFCEGVPESRNETNSIERISTERKASPWLKSHPGRKH